MTQTETDQETTVCRSPIDGRVLGYSPITSPDELIGIIERANVAQRSWAETPIEERALYMLHVKDYLVEHADDIAETIHWDNGKTKIDAMTTEVLASAIAVNYYIKNAKRFLKPEKLRAGNIILSYKRSKIYRVPFGVIGIISPWNYPFTIPFHEVVIALLSGNAVVLKTATDTQMVGRKLEECIQSAGLPDGVFNYINMSGSLAGKTMLENGIDKLFFTGGTDTGSKIMQKAGETLTPVSLELGSNDAMIVCDDADLERAAGGAAWAGLQNSGQSCGGVERIYVHESVYDQFLDILKSQVELMQIAGEDDLFDDLGAMTTSEQMQIVCSQLEDALDGGATIYAESERPPKDGGENYFPAMILTNVTHDMSIMKEETFGPIIGVMKYHTIDEAIQWTNDSNLGLTSSIWSRDQRKAEQIARHIESGAVLINDHLMSHGMAETPWGGFKQSGIGRTHGKLGFHEMTESQVIIRDNLPFVKRDLWWHPYSPELYKQLKALVSLLYGKKFGERIKALGTVLKAVPRMFKRKV